MRPIDEIYGLAILFASCQCTARSGALMLDTADIKRDDQGAREVCVHGRELRLIARHHAATGIIVGALGFEHE